MAGREVVVKRQVEVGPSDSCYLAYFPGCRTPFFPGHFTLCSPENGFVPTPFWFVSIPPSSPSLVALQELAQGLMGSTSIAFGESIRKYSVDTFFHVL